MKSVLLVDDEEAMVTELEPALQAVLPTFGVRTWVPARREENPRRRFMEQLDAETVLVVTDLDLMRRGPYGLSGDAIVAWSQEKLLPALLFTRKADHLAKKPELFEITVPDGLSSRDSATLIGGIAEGFAQVDDVLQANAELLQLRNPSAVLAGIVGPPAEASDFSLYDVRLGSASGSLAGELARTAPATVQPTVEDKVRVLRYIVGHLLLNSVLRFPGPIVSQPALRAYLGSDDAGTDDVTLLFVDAAYGGPFCKIGSSTGFRR